MPDSFDGLAEPVGKVRRRPTSLGISTHEGKYRLNNRGTITALWPALRPIPPVCSQPLTKL
jgi:hypothetical protein